VNYNKDSIVDALRMHCVDTTETVQYYSIDGIWLSRYEKPV